MENKHINLTKNEAIFIDDNICLILCSKNEGKYKCVPLTSKEGIPTHGTDLIKKIGCAILQIDDPANQKMYAEVPLSDMELYLLRELADSSKYYQNEAVGLNLKIKIHSLLFEQDYEKKKDFGKIISNLNKTSITNNQTGETTHG